MIQALDMFSIGIGPSSSHTVGPMKAGLDFVNLIKDKSFNRIQITLYGSLALTGEGHGTHIAVLAGLSDFNPIEISREEFLKVFADITQQNLINLGQDKTINFSIKNDLIFAGEIFLPEHSNGMEFKIFQDNLLVYGRKYFSIGGGFILDEDSIKQTIQPNSINLPHPFRYAKDLLELTNKTKLNLAQLALENQLANMSLEELQQKADSILNVMQASIENGLKKSGMLPGGLQVMRRAKSLYAKVLNQGENKNSDNRRMLAFAFALAVNEENADFCKIVTAPTNGSAGTIPAVIAYFKEFYPEIAHIENLRDFLLVSGLIGNLFKFNASISAAEMGCQGEIGVSCAMAAAGLTHVLGGNTKQTLKAAEIATEHSLGMTCDPVKGLVQIPCIERNGVAATRAIDIAKLVLMENNDGMVNLDQVINAMNETGKLMNYKLKETSLGGLATNVTTC